MDYQNMDQYYGAYGATQEYEPLSRYTAKTFGWMCVGLLITFLVAITAYLSNLIWYVFAVPYAVLILGDRGGGGGFYTCHLRFIRCL